MSVSDSKQEALLTRVNAAWIRYAQEEKFRARWKQPNPNVAPVRQLRDPPGWNYPRDRMRPGPNGTHLLYIDGAQVEILPIEKMCEKVFSAWMEARGEEYLTAEIFIRRFGKKYEGTRKEDMEWIIRVVRKFEREQADEELMDNHPGEPKTGSSKAAIDKASVLADRKYALAGEMMDLADKKIALLEPKEMSLCEKESALAKESAVAEKEGHKVAVPEPRKKKSLAQRRREWDAASPVEVLGYLDDNNQPVTEPPKPMSKPEAHNQKVGKRVAQDKPVLGEKRKLSMSEVDKRIQNAPKGPRNPAWKPRHAVDRWRPSRD